MYVTNEDIINLLQQRQAAAGPRRAKQIEVRDANNGDMAVALPELDSVKQTAVANLLNQGLDAFSQRIASTVAQVIFPIMEESSKKAITTSRDRRDVVTAWWDHNGMGVKMGKRARHYSGYAMSIVQVKPGKNNEPEWVLRDPLTAYPSDVLDESDPAVDDCVFTFQRPWAWLSRKYGPMAQMVQRPANTRPGDMFSMIEYCDCDEWVLLVCGKSVGPDPSQVYGQSAVVRLEWVENRTGMCPVAKAGRISLDRPLGQYDGMIGMFQQQALLQALELIAVRRDVFADTWVEPVQAGAVPSIQVQADGLRGITGVIKDGHLVMTHTNPGYKTDTTMDRLERAQRLQGKIPAEYGGESGSNIRTGVRGDAVLAAVVDFPVQEAQRTFARSLQYENRLAIAIDREWYRDQPKTIWIGHRQVSYVPEQLWTAKGKPYDYHTVSYAMAGADTNSLNLAALQSVGAGTMSVRRKMELDPLIEDVDEDLARIDVEGLRKALLTSIEQQGMQGALPPSDIARMIKLVLGSDQIEDAVTKVQAEAQARQAQQVPPTAPEAQPGIAQPGAGAEQPTVPPPGQGQSNLAGLISALGAGHAQAAAA